MPSRDDSDFMRLQARVQAEGRTAQSPEALADISSEDLVQILLDDGAQLISRDEHGGFVRVRNHLIFVRRARVVEPSELHDALRAAGMGLGRFDRLVVALRSHGSTEDMCK
jgi:hypothetical protein